MAQLQPYLTFNGNCKEAMTFYKDVLGGDLTLMPIGDSPNASQMVPEMKDKIMHSVLNAKGIMLMATDMCGPEGVKHGNTMSLCLVCDSKEEIENLFSKLSQGGTVGKALKEEFFGTYGDLTDKYGFRWMFQFSPNPQK